eukprot:GFUD01073418.1.p1 GENE.GFUD01073418.1~~GFUD01073418.1.p1  ORF type:complete len:120 (-),score=50.04 GFUD01073418.1:385-744(-)
MSESPEQGNKRLAQAQAQVGEVVDIMRVNVEKVLERDSKLSDLDQRADNLQEGASQFQTQATKLKRKYWWQNMKMMMIIAVIVAILLIIIIVWASSGGSDDPPAVTTTTTPALVTESSE